MTSLPKDLPLASLGGSETDDSLKFAKVFNLHVVPFIHHRQSLDRPFPLRGFLFFTFHFYIAPENEYSHVLNFRGAFNGEQILKEIGSLSPENEVKSRELFEQKKIKSSRDVFHIVVMHFLEDSIQTFFYPLSSSFCDGRWEDIMMKGRPKTSEKGVDEWISDGFIRSRVDWDIIAQYHHFFQEAIVEDLILVFDLETPAGIESSRDPDFEESFYLLSLEQVIKACKRALIPKDKQKMIEKHVEKKNLFLISSWIGLDRNFLVTTFKIDEKCISFEYFSSPFDTSLSQGEHKGESQHFEDIYEHYLGGYGSKL